MTSPTKLRIRRCRAQAAVDAYRETLGDTCCPDELLIDLLTDLHHWADGSGLDFGLCFEHAQYHYDMEAGGAA